MGIRSMIRDAAMWALTPPSSAIVSPPDGAKSISGGSTGGWEFFFTINKGKFKTAAEVWESYTSGELEQMYACCTVIYACMRKLYTTSWEAPMLIGRNQPKGFKYLNAHPLLDILNMPFPGLSHRQFKAMVLLHLLCTGSTYVVKLKNRAGSIEKLYPVPTSWVTAKRDRKTGKLLAYEIWQGDNKDKVFVLPEDMGILRFPDPHNPESGIGPLQAALRPQQLDEKRENYMMEMLTNLRMPGMVLTKKEGTWDEPQKQAIRAELQNRLGEGYRGSPLFVGGNGDVNFPMPLKDIDWPGLSTLNETRICAGFGVPPIVIGLRSGLENGTYSNYEQAIKAYYSGTMVPLWVMLDDFFTQMMLRDEGEDDKLEFRHDTSGVKELQADETEIAERAIKLFHGGLITRNRAREMVGEDPINIPELGEATLVPMSMTSLRLDQKPPDPEDFGLGMPDPETPIDDDEEEEDEDEKEEKDKEEKEKGKNRIVGYLPTAGGNGNGHGSK